jgi:MoaA/NifB/PqqE/SkfB family radical SAM enzyme
LIKAVQLDPNGLCNAKCWFCPVAYGGNPKIGQKNMDFNILKNIIEQLDAGRNNFVDPNFDTILNAHYNEVLLYPYFKEMIELYKQYNLKTIIFSNGTTLTKDKIDFIAKNKDVIKNITFNVPSAFAKQWSEYTGLNIKIFDKLIENLKYTENKNIHFGIQVNGVQEESFVENGGAIKILSKAPHLNYNSTNGDVAKSINKFKYLFPKASVFSDVHLNDRSGKLEQNEVLSNQEAIKLMTDNFNKKVIGCLGGENFGKSRSEEWLHINANGDVILCCHDYEFETSYVNIKNKSIKDIWNSQERKDMILKSYNGFCKKCKYAIWK